MPLIEKPFGLTITKFQKVGERQFTARVSLEGVTVDVEYMDGSWKQVVRKAPRSREMVRREVPVGVAAALCDRLPRELRMRKCDLPKPKTADESVAA